jgi:predicted RNA polymerase sigma factor
MRVSISPIYLQGTADQASSLELWSVVTAAIDSLLQELRTVFVLRKIEGLSTLEISEALQLSSEAVRVRFHRAHQALRRAVEKQVGKEAQELFTFAGARWDRTVMLVFRRLGLRAPKWTATSDNPLTDCSEQVRCPPLWNQAHKQ